MVTRNHFAQIVMITVKSCFFWNLLRMKGFDLLPRSIQKEISKLVISNPKPNLRRNDYSEIFLSRIQVNLSKKSFQKIKTKRLQKNFSIMESNLGKCNNYYTTTERPLRNCNRCITGDYSVITGSK